MTTYTERLIAEAEAALEGVTQGEWMYKHETGDEVAQVYLRSTYRPIHEHDLGYRDDVDAEIVANARFIAWARNNVPALIAALRAMQAECNQWRVDCEEFRIERGNALAKLAEVEKERDIWREDSAAAWDRCELRRLAEREAEARANAAEQLAQERLEHIVAAEATVSTLTAQVEAMRGALRNIDALDPEQNIYGFSTDALRGLVLRMGEIARAALTTEKTNG